MNSCSLATTASASRSGGAVAKKDSGSSAATIVGNFRGALVDGLTRKREEGREYLRHSIRRFTTPAGISKDRRRVNG